MNLEELEKEFKAEPRAVREDIYGLIAHIAVHCQDCKVLQEKKWHYYAPEGQKEVDRFPWEIAISGEVTDMVSKLLSGNVKGKLREAAENYRDHHVHYKCKEAEKLITNIYERLTKIKNNPQNRMRNEVI